MSMSPQDTLCLLLVVSFLSGVSTEAGQVTGSNQKHAAGVLSCAQRLILMP